MEKNGLAFRGVGGVLKKTGSLDLAYHTLECAGELVVGSLRKILCLDVMNKYPDQSPGESLRTAEMSYPVGATEAYVTWQLENFLVVAGRFHRIS